MRPVVNQKCPFGQKMKTKRNENLNWNEFETENANDGREYKLDAAKYFN